MQKILRISLNLIPLLVMIIFGYYLMGANFGAELGMIDDHEVAMFLGQDGKIEIGEIPSLLATTEVGEWGEALRFRPVYYTLRITESMLWKYDGGLWYFSRFVIYIFSFYLMYRLLAKFFPRIISYLFVFYALTMPFWPDMLTRLGPSEIYTVPAILIFLWGLVAIIKNQTTNWSWMLLTVGYLICVGSKENFLFLFPIIFTLAGYRMFTKQVTRVEIVHYLVMLALTLYVGSSIIVATSQMGVDFYKTNISYGDRIVTFLKNIVDTVRSRHVEFALLATLVYGVSQIKKSLRNQKVITHLVVIIVIFLIAASQYIFYNNTLPSNSRYDFPALLLFPIMNLVAVRMILISIKSKSLELPAKLAAYGGLAVFMLYFIATRSYTLIHLQAQKNADASSDFASGLDLVEERLKQDDEVPLVFVSHRFIDFEPIVSISRYLTARGIVNPMVIEYTPEKFKPGENLEIDLNQRLERASEMGGESEELFSRFSPLTEYEECYSISFGRENVSECELITSF